MNIYYGCIKMNKIFFIFKEFYIWRKDKYGVNNYRSNNCFSIICVYRILGGGVVN